MAGALGLAKPWCEAYIFGCVGRCTLKCWIEARELLKSAAKHDQIQLGPAGAPKP